MFDKFSMRSSCRAARWSAAGFASFVAVVLMASLPVRAASYSWAVSSGDWSVTSNWGGAVPSSISDTAFIANGGTAAVTTSVPIFGTLSLGSSTGSGTVQLSGGASQLQCVAEYIGNTGTGAFVQDHQSSNSAGQAIYLGYYSGSSGAYSLNGSLNMGGPGQSSDEYIGYSGTGSFTQLSGYNGAYATMNLWLGYNAGSVGSYYLAGIQLTATRECIGYSGSGSFTQVGGKNVNNGSFDLGHETGSSGSYTLGGSGQLATGIQYIGYSGQGSFAQSGGTNSSSGTVYLGTNASGSGAYTLSGSGVMSTTFEIVGNYGNGTFVQSGGTNSVTNYLYIGNHSGSSGTYSLTGGVLVLGGLFPGAGTSVFNFDGGTMRASRNNTTWFSVLTTAYVRAGGAIFDVLGFNETIGQRLLHDPALGTVIDGGLAKSGSGSMTLAAANTYTGVTIVSSGALVLANSLAVQDSTLDTSGGGILSFGTLTAVTLGGLTGPGTLALSNSASSAVALSVGNNNSNTTYSGKLTGSGSLTKIGSGILLLSGSNTYSGPTTINQGKLLVDGWLSNSAVTVNSGGTLGGTGSLANVTVNAGGHLAPGDPQGGLRLSGSLTLASGAAMDYELDGITNDNEVLMPSGQLILSGQQFSNFIFTPLAGFGPGTYILVDAGSINGSLGTNTTGTIDGLPATLSIDPVQHDLVLTVTPEPSTLTLLAAGAVGLAGYGLQRRRMTKRTARQVAFDQARPEHDGSPILAFPSHSAHLPNVARRAA